MDDQATLVQVIRVTRGDTLLVRCVDPILASRVAVYVVLFGVKCRKKISPAIIDWIEFHSENERLELLAYGYVRDPYGRLLGDLCDIKTGERLTDYLLEVGAARMNTDHYADTITALTLGKEPY